MNNIIQTRYGFAGACIGFGASAVGVCHVCPAASKIIAAFAIASFAVCALTFLAEAIDEKRNESAPVETEQAQYEKIFDDLSIAENLGLVKKGGSDES